MAKVKFSFFGLVWFLGVFTFVCLFFCFVVSWNKLSGLDELRVDVL